MQALRLMKKVTYYSKGLRMCLEKAIPRDEEIEGKENVYVTRDEMRTKIKTCISSIVAAARGKNVDDDDALVDVKECSMEAGQSLSGLGGDEKEETSGTPQETVSCQDQQGRCRIDHGRTGDPETRG